ncbi:MAG: beta-eliminating lyase-related protein, partial [Burkholderiales bacterium]|nr:beta-eliminating lyase-related protein [Burkholderiales bacterium]
NELQRRNGFYTADVDDVIMGCGAGSGDHSMDIARMAALDAGWSTAAPGVTLNRFCGSGQQAVNFGAAGILAGFQDLVVGGGVESMSRPAPMHIDGFTANNNHLRDQYDMVPQGISADLIATVEGFSREDLDALAVDSQARAAEAIAEGRFDRALVPIFHDDGSLALADIEAAIKPDDAHFARTRMLALENTWGGKVLPHDYLLAFSAFAKSKGLARHLDGARLFNAAVSQAASLGTSPQTEARRIAQCFDSVSVCFSKGLGAPMGSALCGSRAFIQTAHRWRKMAGGGLRQAGFMAAAASYALDHHIERLGQDHALMQHLAAGLSGIEGLDVQAPQTNILFVDLSGKARDQSAALIAHLKQAGIDITGLYRLRFVTHLDVDKAGIERTIQAVREFFKA